MPEAIRTALNRRPIRCAVYTRQSVDPHDAISSCEVQFEACCAHIRSLRSLGFVLVDERFDDVGYSGTTLDRPALQRLLEVIRTGGIEQLVVHRIDRLSRNLRDFTTLSEELREHNVTLEVVMSPGLGAMALDRMMLSILASFAEFERDLTASRIAEARAQLKAHGRRSAGAIPFGYAADPQTRQLIVCDEEANAVIRMFQWAANGVTPGAIAASANLFGWITGGGNRWTARQVLSILQNPVYAGLVTYGLEFRKGCHSALIDRDVYNRVQRLIIGRRTRVPGRREDRSRIIWIIQGLLLCGGCGRPMSTHTSRKGSVIHRYYRCRSTAGGREPCKGVLVAAHDIETTVLSQLGDTSRLTSTEQAALVQERVRSIVYSPADGTVQIEMLKPPRRPVRDGAEVTE